MNSISAFSRTTAPPLWEGVVFPGLDRENPWAELYEAPVKESLQPYIEGIWLMTWDFPEGTELTGIGMPIPCLKLASYYSTDIGSPLDAYSILGAKTKSLMITFKGQGQSLGVDFKPGGLFPFVGKPLDQWTGGWARAQSLLPHIPDLPPPPWNTSNAQLWLTELEGYLESRLSDLHPHHLDEINACVDTCLTSPEVNSVKELSSAIEVPVRTLQRIFQKEVGVSPLDLIRITRFNRSLKALHGLTNENLAQLAIDSGYFDQPHMANEFRKLLESKPSQFKKFW